MSTGRFHPINNLLEFTLADVAVLLMGFSPAALVVLTPFNLIYSAMVHANLNWTFGPLRYVFASPVFHRWHHTTQEEGLDKNFASTFPLPRRDLRHLLHAAGQAAGTVRQWRARLPGRFLGAVHSPVQEAKATALSGPPSGHDAKKAPPSRPRWVPAPP